MNRLLLLALLIFVLCASAMADTGQEAEVRQLLELAKQNLGTSMDKAVDYSSRALLLAQKYRLPLETAQAQLYLGRGYHQAGVYDQAMKRCAEALKGFEAIDNQKGIADTYEQMGNIYYRLQNAAQVQECYNKSLAIRRKLNDPAELADALNNIGITQLHYLNNPELALKYFQEALQKSRTAKHKPGIAHSLNNIGNYYLMQWDIAKSMEYNQQSLELYREIGDKNRQAINTLIVGYLHQLSGDDALAEKLYFQAIRLARETQSPATIRDANLNLSALYEDRGDELKHLRFYQEYAIIADSIMSVETNRNLANLQTQHAVEKRELENRILRLDIQKQRIILASLLLFCLAILVGLQLINRERRRSDKLLLNILPRKVAKELKTQGYSIPQTFPGVSVLFSDFVDFTRISATMPPEALIAKLSELFTEFDTLCENYGCERIKTIGDAYLAVCGLPQAYPDHAQRMFGLAKEMMAVVARHNANNPEPWQIRIGLHCGAVVGGIVGTKKYIYDVFGDAINTASRMESNSIAMRINVSEDFYLQVGDAEQFDAPRSMEVKGKGDMKMFYVKEGDSSTLS